ncbi:hypothetical protein HDU87_006249 [Geranomyces variabilis]|uniref:Uncharacterized protein n=1 Tax=Geranomyces variabilis TaxID=109894 RepID=A0AAD5XP71_9FUNG|nr:hypothetical protein HDU87_006249 [Geranomyces variabilis]
MGFGFFKSKAKQPAARTTSPSAATTSLAFPSSSSTASYGRSSVETPYRTLDPKADYFDLPPPTSTKAHEPIGSFLDDVLFDFDSRGLGRKESGRDVRRALRQGIEANEFRHPSGSSNGSSAGHDSSSSAPSMSASSSAPSMSSYQRSPNLSPRPDHRAPASPQPSPPLQSAPKQPQEQQQQEQPSRSRFLLKSKSKQDLKAPVQADHPRSAARLAAAPVKKQQGPPPALAPAKRQSPPAQPQSPQHSSNQKRGMRRNAPTKRAESSGTESSEDSSDDIPIHQLRSRSASRTNLALKSSAPNLNARLNAERGRAGAYASPPPSPGAASDPQQQQRSRSRSRLRQARSAERGRGSSCSSEESDEESPLAGVRDQAIIDTQQRGRRRRAVSRDSARTARSGQSVDSSGDASRRRRDQSAAPPPPTDKVAKPPAAGSGGGGGGTAGRIATPVLPAGMTPQQHAMALQQQQQHMWAAYQHMAYQQMAYQQMHGVQMQQQQAAMMMTAAAAAAPGSPAAVPGDSGRKLRKKKSALSIKGT